MKGLARICRWLLFLAILCAPAMLTGCQSATPPFATAPLPGEIAPLGFIQTLAGTAPGSAGASPSQAGASPSQAGASPSQPGATPGAVVPATHDDAADRYPIAKWIKNEKLIPSNDRDWVPEHKVLSTAEFTEDGRVTVHNVRNAQWLTSVDCIVEHNDRSYDLHDLETVDFIVVPFETKSIAHTMLSFGFGQGTYLGISAEIRVERGESYNAALGLARQFELTYVVADERDLLPVRVKHRKADVYIYRTTATPEKSQAMFKDVMARVNQLAQTPEFYDTLSNNCTTNLVRHVNALRPGRVPYDARILLPGYADQLAYQLGLLDNRLPFKEIKRRAWANERIVKYENSPDFSARIRQ